MKAVMEDLRRFCWEGIREGMMLDVYIPVWPWPVGEIQVITFQPTHLICKGNIDIKGVVTKKFDLEVLLLTDVEGEGALRITVDGHPAEYKYLGDETTLHIYGVPGLGEVQVYDRDRKWTHFRSGLLKAGAWPRGLDLEVSAE